MGRAVEGMIGARMIGGLAALVSAALVLVGCTGASGESESVTPNAQQGEVVGQLDEITVERIEYPTHDNDDSGQNWADLYLPAGEQRRGETPLVVLIHGGAWEAHLGAEVFNDLARDLAGDGMAVYNLEYRRVGSGGGYPTTFHDVARGLDHVAELGEQYPQLSTEDELVVGHSAGAQLAAWAGTRHKIADDEVGSNPKFRPTRVVSLAGPLDMVYAAENGDDRIVRVLGGTPQQVPKRYTAVDPIQNIDPATPVVAVHGTEDRMVAPANSQRYVEAVKARDGQAALVLRHGEDHVSLVNPNSATYPHIIRIITDTSRKPIEEIAQE